MSMESFGESFEPQESIGRTVKQALPVGMEGKTREEIEEAVKALDSLLSNFEKDKKVERAEQARFFVQKKAYREFIDEANKIGLPTRFANSYLDVKGIRLSKPVPVVLRPKLTLTGSPEKTQKKNSRVSKDATIDEQVAKMSIEPAQQDMFGFE